MILIRLGLLFAGFGLILVEPYLSAPEGFEDETGLHLGRPKFDK